MSDTMSDTISTGLEQCYTGVLHDVMRAMGLTDFTLPPELRPLFPERRLAGPAFTIDGIVERSADPHQTLLAWTGLLSQAPPGSLWVAQPNDALVAHMGELSAQTLKNKGVRGCVIDGLVRDVQFLIDMQFQTWSRGHTPRDIVGYWLPRAVQVEIRIGTVVIAPGDYLVGDRDGVIRVPQRRAEEISAAAHSAMAAENLVRSAILQGLDPQQAYLRHGKF